MVGKLVAWGGVWRRTWEEGRGTEGGLRSEQVRRGHSQKDPGENVFSERLGGEGTSQSWDGGKCGDFITHLMAWALGDYSMGHLCRVQSLQ